MKSSELLPGQVLTYLSGATIDFLQVRSDLLYVFGDFNKPDIRWELTNTSEATDCSPCYSVMHYAPLCNSVANTDFVDGLHSTGLFQLSGIANQSGRQLDLVFANLAATNILCDSITPLHSVNGTSALENFLPYITHCSIPLLSEDFHHPSLDMMIYYPVQLSHTTNSHTRSTVNRNFFKTNVERMNALIVSFDRNFDCSNFSTIDLCTLHSL